MLKNAFPSPHDMYDREIFFPGMETTICHYFYMWASFLALPLLSGGGGGGGGGVCVCVCVCV